MTPSKPAMTFVFAAALGSLMAACGGAPAPSAEPPPAEPPSASASGLPPDVLPAVDRPELTTAECEAKGGKIVGDIGDGAIHRPEYTCPSGAKPIGRVALGVEGSVCCP